MDIRPRMEFRKAPENVRALHTLYLGSSGAPIADVHVEGMAEQLIDGWNYRFSGGHSRMQREIESLQQLVAELRGERDAAWQVGRDSMAGDIEDIRRERDSAVQQLAVARDVIAEKHAQIVSDNDEILALRAKVAKLQDATATPDVHTIRALLATLEVDGSSDGLYWNQFNEYGCITVKFWVDKKPETYLGKPVMGKYSNPPEWRPTGRFRLNDAFADHLVETIKQHRD